MPQVLIICPTHDHADTLRYSIASVQAQHYRDWRLVVIGDGAPHRTGEIVHQIAQQDGRVTYQDHPKGDGYGEIYRDALIRATGIGMICHLSDDDLWAPTHLDRMVGMLQHATWVYQAPLVLQPEGGAFWRPSNPGFPRARRYVTPTSGVAEGLNNVAYRRYAYLECAKGWAPAAAGCPSDMQMWHRFLSHPKVSVAVDAAPHVLKLASSLSLRAGRTPQERCSELALWFPRLGEEGLLTRLRKEADILAHVLQILATLAINDADNVDEALAWAGLRIAPEGEDMQMVLRGGMLGVPMTAAQRYQATVAFQTRRAMKNKATQSVAVWQETLQGDARLALVALTAYVSSAPDEKEAAEALFAQCFPLVNKARKLRNTLNLKGKM